MFKAKSITFNSKTYMLGQKYKPPGFTKMATVINIVDNRNAFSYNEGGFEVRFDSGDFLRIYSNDVVIHWEQTGGEKG
ncbi:hypothetical protein [Bacillus licheniformis]|uniref:hypothetical protein n=1 Tax=Bacillus licheniformis TaxID=1402 RepID=UPI0021C8BB09|nr:hypothetical protein [Bacillus licheniformis]MEC1037612.1 hypothetical protein [Bacillus licheniformis]